MPGENRTLTPVWIAYVDGRRLDTGYEGALKRIYMHDRLDFAGTASLLFGIPPLDFCNDGTFAMGSEVSIHLGYKDNVHEVFAGEVTGFEPRLDECSSPLTEVKIHSKLHRLNKGIRCASFEHKTPAGIIRDIVQGYNLNADVEDFGPEYSYIEQKNFTDHGYIMYLASKYGKSVYCHGNTLYVKTEITPTDDDVILEWGKTIISARTRTDLAAQLSAVTATGWDMRKCTGFTATATMKDVPLKIGGEYSWEDNAKGYDPHKVEQLCSGSFTDENDAMEVARSVLLGRSMQFQSCDARTEGNSRIRTGNRLTVKYLGKHSDGEYLVYSVEHDFSVQDGYLTTCHLKRNFCGVAVRKNISEIEKKRAENHDVFSSNKFHIGKNMAEEETVFIGNDANQNEKTITTKKNCAWISHKEWNNEYINMYSIYVDKKIDAYIQNNKKFTCEDLALNLLIDFASENHLPVVIKNGSATYSSYSSDFSNIKNFKNIVLSTTGASDLKFNTIEIKIYDVKAGDLICMDTGIPNGTKDFNYSHIQIISNVKNNLLEIRQGNISNGSSKYNSLFYGGESITKRKYDTKNDLFINPDTNINVPNARDAFGMSFRRWNFYGM